MIKPWEQEFDPKVTQADLAALFRLLLGRNPGPLEWQGHVQAEVGQELTEIVRRFLTSLTATPNAPVSAIYNTGYGCWYLK